MILYYDIYDPGDRGTRWPSCPDPAQNNTVSPRNYLVWVTNVRKQLCFSQNPTTTSLSLCLSLSRATQIIMFECFVFWNHYVWNCLNVFEDFWNFIFETGCMRSMWTQYEEWFKRFQPAELSKYHKHADTHFDTLLWKKLKKEILQYFHRTKLKAKRFQYSKWFLLIMHRPTVSGHFRCSIQALKGNLKYSHVGFSAMEYRLQFSTVTLVTTVAFCCSFTGGSFPDLKCHSCSVGDVRWKTDL